MRPQSRESKHRLLDQLFLSLQVRRRRGIRFVLAAAAAALARRALWFEARSTALVQGSVRCGEDLRIMHQVVLDLRVGRSSAPPASTTSVQRTRD